MKKIKLENRVKNAFRTFFEEDLENFGTSNLPVVRNNCQISQNEVQIEFMQVAERNCTILKQVLLFLPGAFILYFFTLASFYFFPLVGFNLQMLFWFVAGSFMIQAGLGDLKNFKYLLVPFSITVCAATFASVFSLFPEPLKSQLFFAYSIYAFPLILIMSVLLGNFVKKI